MSPAASSPAVLCLAHLAWDFVWQRPQHVLSRLAERYPVAYVNEAWLGVGVWQPQLRLVERTATLNAWQPSFPDDGARVSRQRELVTSGSWDGIVAAMRAAIETALTQTATAERS